MMYRTAQGIADGIPTTVGRVNGVLARRNIRPRAHVGPVRLYDDVQAAFVEAELRVIDRWRGRSPASPAVGRTRTACPSRGECRG